MSTNTYTDPVFTTELREWVQNDTFVYVPNECSEQPWNKGFTNWHEGKDNPFYGKKHSPEARKKISESMKSNGYTHSPESRKKMSGKRRSQPKSEETKKKISEGMKRMWASLDR